MGSVLLFLLGAAFLLKIAPQGWYFPHGGQQAYTTLPDGRIVEVDYKGTIPHDGQLPIGAKLGDEWSYKNNSWVWTILPGKTAPEWVDP